MIAQGIISFMVLSLTPHTTTGFGYQMNGFRLLNDVADASARGLVRQQLVNALPLMISLLFVR